ncbi:AMP-binding protein [Actinomadura livida]|uniref:ATP-dependent acyl-CoA ligase n=1 Tax=Actinomadura livida TaxID=79909 RepID=A0A7W7IDH2_9ACTN|nr:MULTISPECIES: AMP-binding protein [Actinomadura]MBB4774723.1 crotonobetaine/carnitine-CoA ligase [Actinomadura catellatispora]GGU06414.1 ATP-dependent acyl-CoA ligase [Actinomadura livida]
MSPDDGHRPRDAAGIVFRYVLEHRAATTPDRVFATFPDDRTEWTWAQADEAANRLASVLAAHGVGRGDRVAVLSDNGASMVQTLLGTTKLGAVFVPFNTGWKADQIRHAFDVARPSVFLCQARYADRVSGVEPGDGLPALVIVSDTDAQDTDSRVAELASLGVLADLTGSASPARPADPGIDVWDPYAVIFTSGTTGRSKGVLCPYGQLLGQVEHPMLPHCTPGDVFMGDMPLYHVGGLLAFMAVLQLGARWVVTPRVRVGTFWDTVKSFGVTHATLLPQVATFIEKQPPRPDDADNPLRIIITGSYSRGLDRWCERFGVEHRYRYYNATELCAPLMTGLDPPEDAATGHVRPGATVRVVDEHDVPVPRGTVGELVVRTDLPWEMFLGYVGDLPATAAAWRNGWYHTGDLFVQTAEDTYQYVDRLKDAIRRRGENISSFEVEEVMLRHPAVVSCAAIGVPADDVPGDEDIKACVVTREDTGFDVAEFIAFVGRHLPSYAVPRYVEVYRELPRTSTQKVRKADLRAAGVTSMTWDRLGAVEGVRK